MELEISVEDLLTAHRVESNRIEFKASWNPDDIYHTICAFANDFDNIGGGYVVIGVEANDGYAIRPVKGVDEKDIDLIQREIVGYNHLIVPAYFPKIIVEEVDGRLIMVLWVTPGVQRPYTVPEYVTSKKDKKSYYYIRYGSNTVRANPEQERELIDMTNFTPFDTRPNFDAVEEDISEILLSEHLKTTKSKLAKQVRKLGVMEVLKDMQLLAGPPEHPYIQNVALMMFCDHADKFFPYTQVEITRFPNGSIKDPSNFVEIPPIKGSVPYIISETMKWLRTMVIEEMVTKIDFQMEAVRRFNYPYKALEEAVVNAFYHRDYMSYQSVLIEIEPECIRVVSFPGIDRSVPLADIEKGERFPSRYYRNRRLGEFLKELSLTEGKSTGIPTIQEELRNNGSPRAVFKTDEDRRSVTVEIPIHPDFLSENENVLKEGENVLKEGENVLKEGENVLKEGENVLKEGENVLKEGENVLKEGSTELSRKERDVIVLLKADKTATEKTLAEKIGCAERTVRRVILALIDKGMIKRVGSRKEGYWEISGE